MTGTDHILSATKKEFKELRDFSNNIRFLLGKKQKFQQRKKIK